MAAILGPVAWGYWFILNLVLRYGGLIHLGAVNGMNREVPAAMGRNDPDFANRVQHAAFSFVLASYLVAAALLLGLAWVAEGTVPVLDIGLTLVLLAGQQLYGFASMTLKARTAFKGVTRLQWASAIIYPLFSVPGAIVGDLTGFIIGQAASYLLVYCLAVLSDRGIAKAVLDWPLARAAVRIGFPIMLVGLAHSLFATVDRWIILSFMNTEDLGRYSLAIMALGALGLLPVVVSQQIYPRMAFSWSKNKDPEDLVRLAARQRRMALVISVPLSTIAGLIAPWAIRTFLPEYAPGIAPLIITLAAPIVYTFGQGYGNVFNVVGLQSRYLLSVVVAGVANGIASVLLVRSFGLSGVAMGTVVGYVVLATMLITLGNQALERLRRATRTTNSD